jgi:2-oxo-4-hydroxy-4-carboxy--5-ureidoimidazoline (OHCU) decarboxylase
MTEYYRGERISDLLQRIEELKAILDDNQQAGSADEALKIITAYADLAIAKAKLTALQGE